jgi:hypothetical protein
MAVFARYSWFLGLQILQTENTKTCILKNIWYFVKLIFKTKYSKSTCMIRHIQGFSLAPLYWSLATSNLCLFLPNYGEFMKDPLLLASNKGCSSKMKSNAVNGSIKTMYLLNSENVLYEKN